MYHGPGIHRRSRRYATSRAQSATFWQIGLYTGSTLPKMAALLPPWMISSPFWSAPLGRPRIDPFVLEWAM